MSNQVHIPQWQTFEHTFASTKRYANPAQDARLQVAFEAPSGRRRQVDGFWDGAETWRVRFAPDETGLWQWSSSCSDTSNGGLHGHAGTIQCSQAQGDTRFERHGPVQLAASRRHLEHADGTPFLWLADTAWNGPLLSSDAEWEHYLATRSRQQFSAVQWVATQWRAAPNGDRDGLAAYTGRERIKLQPAFFQRLDHKVAALRAAGLLPVPVLLWTVGGAGNDEDSVDPGRSLPEDQAILLARYTVARWSAGPVVWILNGDGYYGGEQAQRWRRIGAAVFDSMDHAPVAIHPRGMHLPVEEFRDCTWLDVFGYQSGHGDRPEAHQWLTGGPPATEWNAAPARPFINLEPAYEDHAGYATGARLQADVVRRALWWSLLIGPTAGVSYGGHGVWGWDDGSGPPTGHPNAGIPRPWREALHLPAAEQLRHIVALFGTIDWWRLRPAARLLARQPGDEDSTRFVAASATPEGDLAVVYAPAGAQIELDAGQNVAPPARWFNPRDGAWQAAASANGQYAPPDDQDWLLVFGAR